MNSREKYVRVVRRRGGDGKTVTVYDVEERERENGKKGEREKE